MEITIKKIVLSLINFRWRVFTWLYCTLSFLKYDRSWLFIGRPYIHRPPFWQKERRNSIVIGKNFKAISKFSQNSIGAFQPVFLNARYSGSKIIIGDNVGITGCSIKAMKLVSIGNNVLIGSGVLISDNDSHGLIANEREDKNKIGIREIIIEDDVFIGARSIILKGVRVGKGSVIGAGSVVSKNVDPYTIVGGNPAKFLKQIK